MTRDENMANNNNKTSLRALSVLILIGFAGTAFGYAPSSVHTQELGSSGVVTEVTDGVYNFGVESSGEKVGSRIAELDIDNTVFRIGDDRQDPVADDEAYSWLGESGGSAWVSGTSAEAETTVSLYLHNVINAVIYYPLNEVTWSLEDVTGPGEYMTYVPEGEVAIGSVPSSEFIQIGSGVDRTGTERSASATVPAAGRLDYDQVHRFTEPGMYCVTYGYEFLPRGLSEHSYLENTLRFAVGDEISVDADCGGTPEDPYPGGGPEPQPTEQPTEEPTGGPEPTDEPEPTEEPDPTEEPSEDPLEEAGITAYYNGHADVVFPELLNEGTDDEDFRLRARLDPGETTGLEPDFPAVVDHDSLILAHTDANIETLPNDPEDIGLEFRGIADPGEDVYVSQGAGGSSIRGRPWLGASIQSFNSVERAGSVSSMRIDAVTGVDGGAAPGEVSVHGQTLNGANTTDAMPSTVSIPSAHIHFPWIFSDPGVYCIAMGSDIRFADGRQYSDQRQLTFVIGDEYLEDMDENTVCEGRLPYPEQQEADFPQGAQDAPIVLDSLYSRGLELRESNGVITARSKLFEGVSYSLDDLIFHAQESNSTSGLHLVMDQTLTSFAQLWPQLNNDLEWTIDDVTGPGELWSSNTRSSRGYPDDLGANFRTFFDTGRDITSTQPIPGGGDTVAWHATKPGRYCVLMSWSGTKQDGSEATGEALMTLVLDGAEDPDNPDAKVWDAEAEGALEQTCAQERDVEEPDPEPTGDPTDGATGEPTDGPTGDPTDGPTDGGGPDGGDPSDSPSGSPGDPHGDGPGGDGGPDGDSPGGDGNDSGDQDDDDRRGADQNNAPGADGGPGDPNAPGQAGAEGSTLAQTGADSRMLTIAGLTFLATGLGTGLLLLNRRRGEHA